MARLHARVHEEMAGHLVPPAEGRGPGDDRQVVGGEARSVDPRDDQGMVHPRHPAGCGARDRPPGSALPPVVRLLARRPGPGRARPVVLADRRRRLAPACAWRTRRAGPARLGDSVFLARALVGRITGRFVHATSRGPRWRRERRRQRAREEGPATETGCPRTIPTPDTTAGRLAVDPGAIGLVGSAARLVTCLQAADLEGPRPRNPARCALGVPSNAERRLCHGISRDPSRIRPSS